MLGGVQLGCMGVITCIRAQLCAVMVNLETEFLCCKFRGFFHWSTIASVVAAGYAVGQLVNRIEYLKSMDKVESKVDKEEKKVDVLILAASVVVGRCSLSTAIAVMHRARWHTRRHARHANEAC